MALSIKNAGYELFDKIGFTVFSLIMKGVNFNPFKIKNYFSYKNPIPNDLKSFLVYKFTCTSCSSRYIGETCCRFKIKIEEHLKKENKSHIFKHLHSTETCFDSYNSFCFKKLIRLTLNSTLKLKKLYILTGENLT